MPDSTPKADNGALHHDDGKPPMELLPHDALMEVAKVFGFGRAKYSSHNWCRGMDWSRLVGSCYRHLGAWNSGEDKDIESNVSHLAHLICDAMFLLAYELRGVGKDDRYKVTKEAKETPKPEEDEFTDGFYCWYGDHKTKDVLDCTDIPRSLRDSEGLTGGRCWIEPGLCPICDKGIF